MFLLENDPGYLLKNWSKGVPRSIYSKFANRKIYILLVEDDPILQHIHHIMLAEVLMLIELQGEVHLASSGEEALEMAEKQEYDVIFLDLGLPGINGIEVVHKLKLLESQTATKLIALTAYYENKTRDCLLAGIETILPKPTNMEKLKATLCECLSK